MRTEGRSTTAGRSTAPRSPRRATPAGNTRTTVRRTVATEATGATSRSATVSPPRQPALRSPLEPSDSGVTQDLVRRIGVNGRRRHRPPLPFLASMRENEERRLKDPRQDREDERPADDD